MRADLFDWDRSFEQIFNFIQSYLECEDRCFRDGRKIPSYDEFVSETFDQLVEKVDQTV